MWRLIPVEFLLEDSFPVFLQKLNKLRNVFYSVDKEERKGGNDPEKELQDSGFHDFQRP